MEGHQDFPDAKARRDIDSMERAAAAERHQDEVARVMAALDRDRTDCAHHVGNDDVDASERGGLDGKAEAFGDGGERLRREIGIERHAAVEESPPGEPSEKK